MSKNKLFCQYCDEEVDVEYKKELVTSKINGEDISIEIFIPYCSKCKKELSDPDLEDERYDKLYDKYRKIKKLLSPNEIKSIREKYELSQRAFSRVLGFAESTINRYELGAIQDITNNNIMMLCEKPENMQLLLEQNGDRLKNGEKEKLEAKIKQLINVNKNDESLLEKKLDIIIEQNNKSERRLISLERKMELMNKKIASNNLNNSNFEIKNVLRRNVDKQWLVQFN